MKTDFINWKIEDIKIPDGMVSNKVLVQQNVEAFNEDGAVEEISVDADGYLIKGINGVEALKELGQSEVYALTTLPDTPAIPELQYIPIENLQLHPINSSIYGRGENLEKLEISLREVGCLNPLTVVPAEASHFKDKLLKVEGFVPVDGNSRLAAGGNVGLKGFLARVVTFNSSAEELEALLSANVYRQKSIIQIVRELEYWEEIEQAKAEERRGKAGKGLGSVRDIVARRANWAGSTYAHAKKAVAYMDKFANAPQGSHEYKLYWNLRKKLEQPRGVEGAYKLIEPFVKEEFPQETKIKIYDSVKIINGEYEGKQGVVRVCLDDGSFLVNLDGTDPKSQPKFKATELELIPIEKIEPSTSQTKQSEPPTSVEQELSKKQEELGLGKSKEQVLPSKKKPGIQPEEEIQSQVLQANGSKFKDGQTEAAFRAVLQLNPRQIFELFSALNQDMSVEQLEALWRAFKSNLEHKVDDRSLEAWSNIILQKAA
jgi:ParB-like chromosome segregation protein Spo0J